MLFGKYVNKYYLKYALTFIIGIIALLAVDIYQLRIPEIIGDIVDGLKNNTLVKVELKDFMIEMLIIAFIMFFGRFVWRICIFGNGIKIESDMREVMFKHTEKMSQEYFQENKTGALMALYTNDLQTIRRTFGPGTVMLVDAVFLGALTFIKMWKLDWLLTIISSIPLILLAMCGGIIGKYMSKKFEANNKAFADLSDFANESFSGIGVIKAFVKETKELIQFSKFNKKNLDSTMDLVKAGALLNVIINALLSVVTIIIIGYGGYLVYADATGIAKHVFSTGDLTEFVSYFGTLTWPMMAIGQLINMRSQGTASVKRISTLLDQSIEINDDKAIDTLPIQGKITYNHFNFKYPKTDELVLKDINLTIEAGEMVGIMGKTGSGKTTLVDVLLRIYNLDPNQVLIDNVDIMNYKLKTIRDAISYVPQDNFLFSDTIANNIGFYTDEINKDEIKQSAILSDVDQDISDFAYQYDTVLGERGTTVSGGQKQRISISRALIKNSPILILDDSVSAVDTKTEETIINNLRKIRKGKTTILIAHRITTIQSMDKILIIEDGEIKGFGTHEELLNNNEIYQKQVDLQKLEEEVGEYDE